MSGIMEILLIVAIIVGVFMLPRMMARRPERELPLPVNRSLLTGRMRFAILISFLWPVVTAFFMEPWNGRWPLFIYVAVGPVALTWGVYWVFSGFRKERR